MNLDIDFKRLKFVKYQIYSYRDVDIDVDTIISNHFKVKGGEGSSDPLSL